MVTSTLWNQAHTVDHLHKLLMYYHLNFIIAQLVLCLIYMNVCVTTQVRQTVKTTKMCPGDHELWTRNKFFL